MYATSAQWNPPEYKFVGGSLETYKPVAEFSLIGNTPSTGLPTYQGRKDFMHSYSRAAVASQLYGRKPESKAKIGGTTCFKLPEVLTVFREASRLRQANKPTGLLKRL